MATDGGEAGSARLHEIMDYAIQKEKEAAQFYSELSRKVETKTLAEELGKMSAMEVQHGIKLEKMDIQAASSSPAPKVNDLQIANYTVQVEPSEDMTWQDIVNLAMHREMAAMKMYQDLAGSVSDPGAKKLFENLAAEEASHKLFFERVWDDEILIEN